MAGLLGLLVVAVLASAEDASACTRRSMTGDARRCTLMENLSQCVSDSEDAYWQCRRRNPGFWGAIKCSFANNIDFASCVVETGAFGLVRGALGAAG